MTKEVAPMDSQSNLPQSNLHREIDLNLKRVYEDALQEDLPDRFKVLLAQLRGRDEGVVSKDGAK